MPQTCAGQLGSKAGQQEPCAKGQGGDQRAGGDQEDAGDVQGNDSREARDYAKHGARNCARDFGRI